MEFTDSTSNVTYSEAMRGATYPNRMPSHADMNQQLLLENVQLRKTLRAIRKKISEKKKYTDPYQFFKPLTPRMQRFIPTLQPVEEAVSPFGSTCSPMTPAGQYKLDDDRPRLSCSSLPQTWNSTLRNTEESANKRIDWDIVEDEDPSTTDSTPARTSAQNTPTRNSVTDGLSRLVHETLNTLGAKSDEWRSMDEAQRFCSPTSENSLQKPIRVSLRQLHNPEDAEGSNSPITEGIESKREATAMFGSLSQLDEMCENHRTNNPSKLGETAECPHARTVEDQETRSTVCLSETYLSPTSSTDQSEEKHANCLGVLRSQVKNIETVRTSRNRSVLEEDYTPRGIPTNFSTIFSNDAKSPPLDCMGHPTAHPERSLSPRRTMQNASMYRKSITRKRKLEDPIKTEGSSNENESLDGPRQLRQRTFRISYKEPSLRKKLRRETKKKIFDPFLYCKAATLKKEPLTKNP